MPHAVLKGQVDLAGWARAFRPIVIRRGADVLRADRVFCDGEGRNLLVEALVVESGRKQPFYVKLSRNDGGGVTIRVDPMTHPERSDGVRDLVAHLTAAVIRVSPHAEIGSTNLILPPAATQDHDEEGDES